MTPEEWAEEIMGWGYEGEPSLLIGSLRAAIAEEREACARMVERHNGMGGNTTLAAAIRART